MKNIHTIMNEIIENIYNLQIDEDLKQDLLLEIVEFINGNESKYEQMLDDIEAGKYNNIPQYQVIVYHKEPSYEMFDNTLVSECFKYLKDTNYGDRKIYIIKKRLQGHTYKEIAEEFGVSNTRISQIAERGFKQMRWFLLHNMDLLPHGYKEKFVVK